MPAFPAFEPTLPVMIGEASARWGVKECVVTPDRRLTYAQLDAESQRVAVRLIAAGVTKGTRVGVLLPNSVEWVLTWAAAGRIGALVVPINTFYRKEELVRALRHADVQVLVTRTSFAGRAYLDELEEAVPELADVEESPMFIGALPQLRYALVWHEADRGWTPSLLSESPLEEPIHSVLPGMEASVHPSDPAVIIYTSGSTAEPKGVIHSQGALVRHAFNLGAASGLTTDARVWTPMPLFWVGGFEWCLLRTLACGATFLTQEVFDPAEALDLIVHERVTHAVGWAPAIRRIAELPAFAHADVSAIRSGPLRSPSPDSPMATDPTLTANGLGMTETCGPHTISTPEEELHGVSEENRGSFGLPIPGTEHRIVDPTTDVQLPDGSEGEVRVRGYNLMLGLYKRERAEIFDSDGWYHTGDLGFLRDGRLFFTGRLDDLIKSSGSNVSPSEVEVQLRSFPEVAAAFVVGVSHPDRGKDVVALVVPANPTAELDTAALRDRLRPVLASYKLPRRVFRIEPVEVVMLPSQKPDRSALTALAVRLSEVDEVAV